MSRVLKYQPQRVRLKRVNPEKRKSPKITMTEEREKEKVPKP